MIAGHKIVKAFGRERQSIDEFTQRNERLYDAGWRAQFVSGIIMPLMRFVGNIGYVFVAAVGGIMVIQGKIAIGDVQAFIQYSQQFTQPITQIANFANVIQSSMASAERVFELLDERRRSRGQRKPKLLSIQMGGASLNMSSLAMPRTIF